MIKIISIEELKDIQLDILQHVHDFCVKNGIHYTLAFGTLLGAVRHKGFIPWDDDIDIAMPRPDYDRFVVSYHGGENYSLCEFSKDEKYNYAYAKVEHKRTVVEEKVNMKKIGVNIDVFPVDNMYDTLEKSEKYLTEINRQKKKIRIKLLQDSRKMQIHKRIGLQIAKLFYLFASQREMVDSLRRLVANCGKEGSRYVGVLLCNTTKIIPRSVFNDYILLEFEGRTFYTVKDYDTWLRAEYGDYMTPPPIGKRTSPHTLCKIYWKE